LVQFKLYGFLDVFIVKLVFCIVVFLLDEIYDFLKIEDVILNDTFILKEIVIVVDIWNPILIKWESLVSLIYMI